MPPPQVRLEHLFFKGFHGGMQWETKPYQGLDEEGNSVTKRRFLLRYEGSNRVGRLMWRGLDADGPKKGRVSYALADLIEYAADNVDWCAVQDPEEFWGYAKDYREWTAELTDAEFWGVIRRCFHARAIFLNVRRRRYLHYQPTGHPLMHALDNFKAKFDEYYDPNDPSIRAIDTNEARVEQAQEQHAFRVEITNKYFGLCDPDGQGDGTDEVTIKATAVPDNNDDMEVDNGFHPGPVPQDMVPPPQIGWWFDLGPNNPRYGSRNAAEQIEDAMDAADNESKSDDDKVDDDEDVAMDISDDSDMDVDMTNLTFRN